MTTSRRHVQTAALCSGIALLPVVLAGCSGDDSTATSAPTSTQVTQPTTPADPAAVTWANGVCSASTALQSSLQQAGGALLAGAEGSGSTADAGGQPVASVQQSVQDLRTALMTLPADAEARVAGVQERLVNHTELVQAAMKDLRVAADEVRKSDTTAETQDAVRALADQLTDAQQSMQAFTATLRQATVNKEQALQSVFAAAPACRQLTLTSVTTTA